MPRPRFKKLDPERRAHILEVAGAAFAATGYADTSYNALIEALGLSKGVMYYYFDDKADLFLTTLEWHLGGLGEIPFPEEVPESVDAFWGAVEGWFAQAWTFLNSSPTRTGLYRAASLAPAQGVRLGSLVEIAIQKSVALLRLGQAVGAVRTDLPEGLLANVLMGMGEGVDRWLAAQWEGLGEEERQRLLSRSLDLFKQVCAPPSS